MEQDDLDQETADARKAIAGLAKSSEGATDDLVSALETAIADLDSEIQGVKYGDDTDTTDAAAALSEARDVLSGIETAKTNTANKENAAHGKALLTKFGFGTVTIDAANDELDIDTTGVGSFTDIDELEETDTDVGKLGDWKGTEYEKKTPPKPTTANPLTAMDHAVIYTSQGDGESVPLADNLASAPGLGEPAGNRYPITNDDTDDAELSGDDFPKRGTTIYTGVQKFTGTYAGIPGTFECPSDCRARNDGEDITITMGVWHFTPSSSKPMVTQPDDDYLYFGSWLQTNGKGEPVGVSAFHGETYDTNPEVIGNPAEIGGTATYSGKAAGRFAIYVPQDKTGDAGHFTADVTLTAKFAAWGSDGGVSGTVNGFMADGESVPWLVTLERANWNAATGAFGDADFDYNGNETTATGERPMTAWSLDGDKDNAADSGGSWEGSLYDEATAAAATGDDDGTDIPTSATGVFHSKFGATHEMVGGFGANLNSN